MANESPKRAVLSNETLVPLGVIVIVAGSILTGLLWLSNKLSDLKHGQDVLTIKVDSVLGKSLDREDFEQWVDLFAAKNRELDIPRPTND